MQVLDDTIEMLIHEFGIDIVGPAFIRIVKKLKGPEQARGWKSKLIMATADDSNDVDGVQLLE